MEHHGFSVQTIAWLAGAGLVTGLGNLLASQEKLTPRIVIGRALSSAGLGASSATVLTWIPGLPLEAMLGIACLIASLGTSGLERLLQRMIGVK